METRVSGSPAAATACPLTLSALRRQLLALIVGSPLFSDAEQLRANHAAHECACPVRLSRWLRNVRRVAAEREQADLLAGFAQGIARFEARFAAKQAKRQAEQQPTQPTALDAKLAERCPTAEQCDELLALSFHPSLTTAERAQTRLLWPSFTHATATAYIAKMWVRVLRRGGRLPQGVVSTING